MSHENLSTQPVVARALTPRTVAGFVATSLAATAVIYTLAFGTRGVGAIGRLAHLSWTAHAPRLSLLAQAPVTIQLHVAGVTTALVVGLVILAGVKGTAMHRTLGWIWVGAMLLAAVSSLFIHIVNPSGFSFLHLFAGWTLIALPMGLWAIRTGRVRMHARMMTGLFTGGLVVAGLFAFLPGRLMWRMIFG